ncbi:MAG: response regulator [Actinobacteria bacterium]|nr:response regulator [Actinomycetota bacterium]
MVVLGEPGAKRVLLVDDHVVLRRAVRDLIDLSDRFTVVDEASNGDDALRIMGDGRVDIVLMDVNMPGLGGIEATRRIKRWHPDVEVVALSATGDVDLVQGMIDAGAAGYVLKGGSPEELLQSLQAVAEGKGVLDDTVARDVFNQMSQMYREQQARADELDEVNRMKTEFISVISHELQTPLSIMKAGLHLLHHREDTVDDETKDVFFTSLAAETDKLIHVVDQMLTVAAIQKGDVFAVPEEMVMSDIALGAITSMKDHPGTERMTLDIRDDAVLVTGDRGRLVKVVRSLIDNALRFSSEEVSVVVDRNHQWGQLTVTDRGPGLEASLRERVLREPFVQGDSSNTREHGGLGLSLYIANGVLEACGGQLRIGEGPGGSFRMMLPLLKRQSSA